MEGRGVVRAVGLRESLGELTGAQPVQRLVHVLLQVLVAADRVVLGDGETVIETTNEVLGVAIEREGMERK